MGKVLVVILGIVFAWCTNNSVVEESCVVKQINDPAADWVDSVMNEMTIEKNISLVECAFFKENLFTNWN